MIEHDCYPSQRAKFEDAVTSGQLVTTAWALQDVAEESGQQWSGPRVAPRGHGPRWFRLTPTSIEPCEEPKRSYEIPPELMAEILDL